MLAVRAPREATDLDVCVRLAKWRSCSRSWLPAFASDLTGFENRYGMGGGRKRQVVTFRWVSTHEYE